MQLQNSNMLSSLYSIVKINNLYLVISKKNIVTDSYFPDLQIDVQFRSIRERFLFSILASPGEEQMNTSMRLYTKIVVIVVLAL